MPAPVPLVTATMSNSSREGSTTPATKVKSKQDMTNVTGGVSSGSTGSSMYRMKPLFESQTIELPHGMYRVSPVSFITETVSYETNVKSPSRSSLKSSPVVPVEKFSTIEKRQLEILDKLNNLREVIVGIHEKFVGDENVTEKRSAVDEYMDIVVNANPNAAPFSILFLHKLLSQYYGPAVELRSHLHSSIVQPVHDYLAIFNTLASASENHQVLVKITLIWKDTDEIGFMVNPLKQTEVLGEGNLARFLSRLIPAIFPLNYDTLDWNTMSLVDGFISQALDETTFTLQMVEGYLKGRKDSGGPFLLGGISIADFITFSAVARELLKDLKSISLAKYPCLRKWLDHCQEYGEFQLFGY